jgi:hypothetical protein
MYTGVYVYPYPSGLLDEGIEHYLLKIFHVY